MAVEPEPSRMFHERPGESTDRMTVRRSGQFTAFWVGRLCSQNSSANGRTMNVLAMRQRLGLFVWPRGAFIRIERTSGPALRECRLRSPHFLNARPAGRARGPGHPPAAIRLSQNPFRLGRNVSISAVWTIKSTLPSPYRTCRARTRRYDMHIPPWRIFRIIVRTRLVWDNCRHDLHHIRHTP